jgi:60 kDa SS-A/Ro ribonucleoprotein
VKRGLARAFTKFDAYQLAKYNRRSRVKLRDVLFLCHAKPKNEQQAATWKNLVEGSLELPTLGKLLSPLGRTRRRRLSASWRKGSSAE